VLVVCSAWLAPDDVLAQDRQLTPDEVRKVETLTSEAATLRKQGQLAQALSKLVEAIHIYPAPPLIYNLARTYEDAGLITLAKQHYQRCLAKGVKEATRVRAEVRLSLIHDNVPHGTLGLEIVPAGATVTINGVPVGNAPLPPFELREGEHLVRVEKQGYRPYEERIDMPAVKVVVRKVVLEDPNAPRPPGSGMQVVGEPAGASPWQWVSLGVGVAMLAGGTALYLLGEADYQEIESAENYDTGPVVQMTPKRAQELMDSAEAKQTAGWALFGVGGAAVAASTVLFILDATVWADEPESTKARPALLGTHGGAVIGLQGRF